MTISNVFLITSLFLSTLYFMDVIILTNVKEIQSNYCLIIQKALRIIFALFISVAKMCQANTVFENDKDGNDNFDSVFFSLTEQDNNCYCNVSIKNIETSVDLIINRLNNLTGNSLCGMEIDILQVRSQQEIFLLKQIPTRCDSKENTIRLSLFYDEYLRFTSRVVDGEFSVGYCIQIIRGSLINTK